MPGSPAGERQCLVTGTGLHGHPLLAVPEVEALPESQGLCRSPVQTGSSCHLSVPSERSRALGMQQ